MFAVNRFVVAPNDTVSAGAQNHGVRENGAACELAERPVGCYWLAAWQRRLQAQRETAASRTAEFALILQQ